MLRSKSRSRASDFERKKRSSVLSRTLSASSRICRCKPLIDKEAIVEQRSPVEKRPPAKIVNSSENGIVRVSTMQRQMTRLDEEMKLMKDQLNAVNEERDRALDELRATKMMAHEAAKRLNEGSRSPQKGADEKDLSLQRLNEELRIVKVAENRAMNLYAESKDRIFKLEEEVERGKMSESKMFESIVSQTKQLEVTKIELEESKIEIAFLHEQLEMLQNSSPAKDFEHVDFRRGALETLRSELKQTKENLVRAQEGEISALSKANDLMHEIEMLKTELNDAVEGEEKSQKAMEHLALALKEVATEANVAKEKVSSTVVELDEAREEAEKLRSLLRKNEQSYAMLLHKAQQQNLLHKNTVERLRQEAEESLLAWNGKEMGFVDCIKEVEEKRDMMQQENARLYDSLRAAEKETKAAKEDNHKLRDILKQALSEVKLSTETATIAREENSELKDVLAEKEEIIRFLMQENARLQIESGHENTKELKRLRTSAAASTESNKEESGMESEVDSGKFMSPDSGHEDSCKDETRNEIDNKMKVEALKNLMFSSMPGSPKTRHYHRRKSSAIPEDTESTNAEEFKRRDDSSYDSSPEEKNSQRRTALLRRFGDILMMKSLYGREPTVTYQ